MNDELVPSTVQKISLLDKILSIYSPSGREHQIASILHAELKRIGLSPKIDSAGNVLCQTGEGEKSVLLCGHMDTVPGEFGVRREGDLIYARGACDAKGPLMSLLFAFEEIASKGMNARINFAGVVDEEGESKGLEQLIRDGVKCDFAIFGEPGGLDKITIGYRGHLPVFLTIETPEVHASAPWLGANSVELGMSVYEELKTLWSPRGKPDKKTDNVSISLTQIEGGTAHNVSPGKTTMTLDVRIPVGMNSADIRSRIESIIETRKNVNKGEAVFKVNFGQPTEAYRADMGSKLVRAVNRAIVRTGRKPIFITKSGTGDMNSYALRCDSEAITYGPGDTKLSHTPNEKISTKEVLDCASIIYVALQELFP